MQIGILVPVKQYLEIDVHLEGCTGRRLRIQWTFDPIVRSRFPQFIIDH